MVEKRIIYMDHAATTYTKPKIAEHMLPYYKQGFGNPSSVYAIGRKAKAAVEKSRDKVGKALNAPPEQIYFTSGGTESDNWALKGAAYANIDKGNHIITTQIEHHAVLNSCEFLRKHGFEITYLPVDEFGLIKIDELIKSITDKTVLISVMMANNEIGTIQPIMEIGRIARDKNIYFHTDAVQAVGNIKIDVDKLNIDLLSLSAHKFYGPKGIGALYIRDGVNIDNLIHGGAQEKNRRAGTENVPGIVGLGEAIEVSVENMDRHIQKLTSMRDKLIKGIMDNIPDTRLNGPPDRRLPGNVNITFEGIDGESLLILLDEAGICASAGSACSSGAINPSHVLLAIGLSTEQASGTLRFTLGDENTEDDIDYVIEVLINTVKKLRNKR